jgi:hypothetical protein
MNRSDEGETSEVVQTIATAGAFQFLLPHIYTCISAMNITP